MAVKHISLLAALLALILTACASGGDNPDRTPLPTSTNAPTRPAVDGPDGIQQTPLPPPPPFRAASAYLTVENIPQSELLGRLDPPGEPSSIFAYTFSPDGTRLAALDNNQMMMWDLISGERVFTGPRQDMSYYYFSPDKDEIYGITLDGRVRTYETTNAEAQSTFTGHPRFNGAHAFDADTGLLAMGGNDGVVRVWNTQENISLITFDAHPRAINIMAFSPDRQYLATNADDNLVRIWDWRNGEQLTEIDLGGALLSALAFHPGNNRLAVATTQNISIWTVIGVAEADFEYTLLTGQGGATDVLVFSENGQYLINGGNIDAMNVWDGETGDLLVLLPGVGGQRISAAFHPDSNLLLTAVLDGPAQLWNLDQIDRETGSIAGGTLNVPSTRIIDVDWTPDGFQMLFFDASGSVFVWGIPPEMMSNDTDEDA